MASLLVFFSAMGGTLGSRLVGYLFKNIGGQKAFYFSLDTHGYFVGMFIFLLPECKKNQATRSQFAVSRTLNSLKFILK